MLHPLLARQLKRIGLDGADAPPDPVAWERLLARVTRTYEQADQDRYTLERSLTISSREMKELYESLAVEHEHAVTDALTGLTNHRGAHLQLESLVAEAVEAGQPLALILADVDGFKLFNDTYGHTQGDEVLKLVARTLREACPRGLPCRYGGDEFLLILPGQDRRRARIVARGLSRQLGRTGFATDGGERVPVSLSIGLAGLPDDAKTIEKLIAYADSAMYDAKQRADSDQPATSTVRDAPGEATTFGALDSLVRAIDLKDRYTKRHCDVVASYAMKLAARLSLSTEAQRALRIAGLLHDVGKLVVPDEILKKPGPLTSEETVEMQRHVRIGEVLIREVPQLNDVLQAVSCHHERFDGTGYPRGLKGGRIPLLGRIIAVADAYSAMSLDRPYRKALSSEQVISEIEEGAGSQFDPKIARAFVELLRDETDVRQAA